MRNALATVQTVPPEPGIILLAVMSVMGVPHDYIPGIKRTADVSVLKLNLAQAGEFKKQRDRSGVPHSVNRGKRKAIVRFKLPSVDDVRQCDGAPVEHF